MNEYKLFVQRIGLIGVTNILVALSSLIILPIVTKSFSIDDYGVWVQINTTLSLLPNFATLGLPYTMVRFLSNEKDKKKICESFYSIFCIVFISTFIISLLLCIFSKNIASLLFNNNANITILLSLIVFFACLNGLLLNYFRTFQEMKKYSIFLLIQTYLGVLIASYFATNKFGIYMATLGLFIANIITFVLMISFILSSIGFSIPKFKNVREYLSFGLPTIPGNISSWIVDSSDRYVIGIFLGTAFVGYYSPGYTLGNIIMMIVAPFSLLLPSILPKYYDEDNMQKVKVFLRYSMKYFLLIAIPSAFGLSLLSKPILIILTTPEIANMGYLITPFISLSSLLFGVYAIISNVIVLKKKTKIIGTIWIIAAILNLSLNLLLVPYLGMLGAASITLVAYAFPFIITLKYSIKHYKLDFDLIFIIKSLIASLLMSCLIILIKPQGLLNIIITVLLCSIFYFSLLLILKGIKKEEFKFFNEILSNN